MTGNKTQPQELLESILPIETRNESEKYPSDPEPLGKGETKFPTIEEQNEYWKQRNARATQLEPKPPRKWSLARRRKFNLTLAKKKREAAKASLAEHPMYDYPPSEGQIKPWDKLPEPPQQPVPAISHCPFCGGDIQRFLA